MTELDAKARSGYRLRFGGPIVRGESKEPYDTANMYSRGSGSGFAIFVMSKNGIFYSGSHNVGIFHHSSFLTGADVASAGEMKVEHGKLTHLTNKSGHYKPDRQQMMQAVDELKREGVDMTDVSGTFFRQGCMPEPLGSLKWF